MFKVLGIGLILVAIALAGVPRLTDCESQGEALQLANGAATPMKCHWTGIAEIGVAIPLYIVGAAMVASRRRNTLLLLSFLGISLGGLAIAFPTTLIGVCDSPTMICATTMKPALIVLGFSAMGMSFTGLALSRPVRLMSELSALLQSVKAVLACGLRLRMDRFPQRECAKATDKTGEYQS